jgi:hypothetical protein
MKNKDIPKKIAKRLRYVRGQGFRILRKDGTFEVGAFYAKAGAAMMLIGTFHSHAVDA